MERRINESDWKSFRQLRAVALERFCQRVIEEVRLKTDDCSGGYYESYLKVFALMQKSDKQVAEAFDNMRRSWAFEHLAIITRHGLLTEDELMQLSEETREAIKPIGGA